MRRFTVMGFTEAELGFVVAAVFAALAVSGLAEQRSAADLTTRNALLARRFDSLTVVFSAYRDSVRKKSNKTPRCSEFGESPSPIAQLRILGRNRYGLEPDTLTFAQIEARLASQIARSRKLGCHYLVQTIAVSGVDGPDHSAAIGKLWTHFDVSERHP